MSWLIADEVKEGRHELNFSDWHPGENEEGLEGVEKIRDNEMPPRQYLLLHPEARLSDAEVEQLIAGLRATFGPGPLETDYGQTGEVIGEDEENEEYEVYEEYEEDEEDEEYEEGEDHENDD